MSKVIAASRRPGAERACEHALVHVFGCTHTRRALRTKFAKVDFFGCDVIGVKPDGARLWVQVTAGQAGAVRARRKKLDQYPWHRTDRVFVWQLVARLSISNPKRKEWYFRVWERRHVDGRDGCWGVSPDPIRVEDAWFKALKQVEGKK